jgi:hypothetical protein
MSFSNMKKSSTKNTDGLIDQMNKMNTKSKDSYKDDRFWKPTLDKSSNGFAVIRFLPAVDGEDVPWVRVFNHGFKGKGGWMIENCPTTIGGKCPVCEANGELWNSGTETDKDIARSRKRKLQYIANVMVVSDPKNPQNDGKVFLYKFGKQIFDKLQDVLQPEFEDEDPINPFDFWKGADFKVKVRKVSGFVNYDKSEFDSQSELFDGDDKALEALWKTQYPLQQFVASDQFKSYDELKARFVMVTRGGSSTPTATAEDVAEVTKKQFSAKSDEGSDSGEEVTAAVTPSEDDDALSYFEKLANED